MTIKERVIIDRDNHVAHVRMARTDRANSLDLQMFQALIEAGKVDYFGYLNSGGHTVG